MEKSNIEIRLEKKEEHQKVENLVRESFWDVYRPGSVSYTHLDVYKRQIYTGQHKNFIFF